MINNTPCLRNKIPTLVTISATAIALLLLASPLVLFNLVPVQAQTNLSFQTPTPANGEAGGTLTFNATGTASTTDPSRVEITNGTIQWQWGTGQTYNGEITSVNFNNNTRGGEISFITMLNNHVSGVSSPCRTAASNSITLTYQNDQFRFNGPVECSSSQVGGNTTSSSMTAGTTTPTQDSDGDGIPDSSDRCTHNSNPKCFKEGDTTSQQQSSSTSLPGNQTR